jgi:hypothetical protein
LLLPADLAAGQWRWLTADDLASISAPLSAATPTAALN